MLEQWRIDRLESMTMRTQCEVAALRSDVRHLGSKIDALNTKVDAIADGHTAIRRAMKDSSATWNLVLDQAWWLVIGLVMIGLFARACRLI